MTTVWEKESQDLNVKESSPYETECCRYLMNCQIKIKKIKEMSDLKIKELI